jgi:hypothetical protein
MIKDVQRVDMTTITILCTFLSNLKLEQFEWNFQRNKINPIRKLPEKKKKEKNENGFYSGHTRIKKKMKNDCGHIFSKTYFDAHSYFY